ncbi:hypothetical protein [Streptomyces natalensis]|uniref:hypothetical protein n=1 Tax=Streptomyces natalensis TaxID=68242 RepID=UPI0005C8B26D|nr:hypothetical protein [Streptomyces natalensis]
MSTRTLTSTLRRWLAIPAAANALLLATAQPAHASAPAGTIIDIASMTGTGTTALHWSGSYSCTGTTPLTLSLIASDTKGGGLNNVTTSRSVPCPATGAAISGVVKATTGTWRSPVVWQAALSDGDTRLASTDGDVANGKDDDVTLDSGAINPDGTMTVAGTLRCSVNGGSETLTYTFTQGTGTTARTATEAFNVNCPATAGSQGTWSHSGWGGGWGSGGGGWGGGGFGGGWGRGWGGYRANGGWGWS